MTIGPQMSAYLASEKRFAREVVPFLTNDGLLPCKYITITERTHRTNLFFTDSNIPLYPLPVNLMTANYLASHTSLWDKAELRVNHYFSICGSAPVFGVPFQKAVEIALSKGEMCSKFYFPERIVNGRYETLLIQLDRKKDVKGDLLQLQAWQYTPGTQSIHYLHALSNDFKTHFCHLDGAVIDISCEDLELFLQKSRKEKGDKYEKFFRIDGQIEIEHMHNLAKTFFATEELYDEAFEIADMAESRGQLA